MLTQQKRFWVEVTIWIQNTNMTLYRILLVILNCLNLFHIRFFIFSEINILVIEKYKTSNNR